MTQQELMQFEHLFSKLKNQVPINANAVNAVFEAIEKSKAQLGNQKHSEKTLL